MMLRATALLRAADVLNDRARKIPFDLAVLASDERHVRRRTIELVHGDKVLVDFPEATVLEHQDVLVLDDGRHAEIIAAEEELHEIRGRDHVHLTELAWHIGNRHLTAQIEETRILILRDHVIKAMLEGLGATVTDAYEIFSPLRGAYSGGHAQGHGPHDHHGHHHDDGHHRHHD
jgi:urease accessory protein